MSLAIIGVIAAIAAPRYNNSIARYRVDLAARRIAADLKLAQTTARTSSVTTTVLFLAEKNLYEITGVQNPYDRTKPFIVQLQDDPHRVTIIKVDFGANHRIDFNGYGDPSVSGALVIQSGNVQRTIHVDGTTGATRIQ